MAIIWQTWLQSGQRSEAPLPTHPHPHQRAEREDCCCWGKNTVINVYSNFSNNSETLLWGGIKYKTLHIWNTTITNQEPTYLSTCWSDFTIKPIRWKKVGRNVWILCSIRYSDIAIAGDQEVDWYPLITSNFPSTLIWDQQVSSRVSGGGEG